MAELRHDTALAEKSTRPIVRPVPFTLRVAVVWTAIDEMPQLDDGQLFYQHRTPLTGALAMTDAGRDVSFTDVEVL